LVLRVEGRKTSLELYEERLATLLGPENYINFISRIDPVYGTMRALATSRDVDSAQLKSVYADFVSEQQRALINGAGGLLTPQSSKLISTALGANAGLAVQRVLEDSKKS
jgi:hypothetical protein